VYANSDMLFRLLVKVEGIVAYTFARVNVQAEVRESVMTEYRGHCPICAADVTFRVEGEWLRDQLICPSCPNGSIPRERALALVLDEVGPAWRDLRVHESSPSSRGISAKLSRECRQYVATQFFPGHAPGAAVGIWRNEDLARQTFSDHSFDIVVSLDVMEHVYEPERVFQEIHRTLVARGLYISTFPVRNAQVAGWERRFELMPDGSRRDIKEPEIHGNPVNEEGAIVTVDWGYDLHKTIADWAPFDVRVHRFADRTHGILGEYTEVVVCSKRPVLA